MNIIGIIFWIFIAVKVGTWIGNGIGGEVRIMNEKAYDREEQKIKMKYNGGQKYGYSSKLYEKGNYDRYKAEVAELKKKWGK